MQFFRLLLEHLAWIEHEFLSGIRDSRKARCLWGMMRGVEGVRRSIHQIIIIIILMWPVFVFRKGIIALWCQLHWTLYQENLNVHSWMIFCPDGIIPDSDLTGLNNTHTHTHTHTDIYIYIYILFKKQEIQK